MQPWYWKCLGIVVMGGLGSLARYGLTEFVEHWVGKAFPYGTMSVNLLGCLLFGIVWGCAGRGWLSEEMRLILLVGFLGGFTTFSSFAFHNDQMIEQARYGALLFNLLVQNIVGILAIWVGIKLVSS